MFIVKNRTPGVLAALAMAFLLATLLGCASGGGTRPTALGAHAAGTPCPIGQVLMCAEVGHDSRERSCGCESAGLIEARFESMFRD